jgi:hypothetical protein
MEWFDVWQEYDSVVLVLHYFARFAIEIRASKSSLDLLHENNGNSHFDDFIFILCSPISWTCSKQSQWSDINWWLIQNSLINFKSVWVLKTIIDDRPTREIGKIIVLYV